MAKVSDKTTLATAVYQKLRMDIINGSFKPGEKLRIETIAANYEVGSNAVREALSRLSSERLVDRHEQRGFSVPSIALEEWRVLVKTRCWLETRALEESINNRTAVWEEGIVVAFHRLSRYKSSGFPDDRPGWEDAHRSFHRALLSNCGSPWLLDFCDILADHAARYVSVSNAYRTVPRDGTAEHEALMRVVIDGNSQDACAALITHYTRTLQLIEHLFDGGVMTGNPAKTTDLPAIDPAELLKLNF
jgi:GntR family carbon starvation induced transcriptional regulator